MTEFQIYHVSRNTARHNYELDDRLYGTPEQKVEEDWTIKNVEKANLYIQRVKAELNKLDTAIDDMAYLLRENGHPQKYDEKPGLPSLEAADAHVFHSFHVRQFGYAEKLSQMLQSMSPKEIGSSSFIYFYTTIISLLILLFFTIPIPINIFLLYIL